ncbi:MAG TPA: TetR/AcrR family transcriptional regulator [Spongiibacteraceae bacterium]|nr:TetR/AcrR family transcriptional regulator [Spongiibacteraceae bacterium]
MSPAKASQTAVPDRAAVTGSEVPTSHRANKRAQCRDDILRAAETIFKERGFISARMADIARAANISEKTLFNYFSGKPALLEALTLDWFESNQVLFEEPQVIAAANIEQVLPPALDRRLAAINEYRWLLAMTAIHTDLFVSHRQPQALFQHNFAARVQRVRQMQKEGIVRADIPAAEICNLYLALRNHLLGSWLASSDVDFKTLQKQFQRGMAVFLRGLKPE